MIEITKNLFIGNQVDYETDVKFQTDWLVIHACKEPYHRNALKYTGRGAPKNHPEYLIAKREKCLILNLVDVDNVNFIAKEIIDTALDYIECNISKQKILLHCNQGQSRSATIGLLYLAKMGIIKEDSFEKAETEYLKRYPHYAPALGMRNYARLNWNTYKR